MKTIQKLKKTIFIPLAIILTILIIGANTSVSGSEGTVETITYHSTTQNATCTLNVYLPAGYYELSDSANYYPAFYLIHGGGENYTHWVNYGTAHTTLNTYIASGEAVPMILVMPDGKNLAADVFSNELINDIIPYIESNYRVKGDKDHRGVGGLSWGGLQAMEAGIYQYELFGYLAILSSGWFETETATYDRARAFLEENGAAMENSTRYIYFSEGTYADIAYDNGLATLQVLRDYDLTVHYWEHPGGHSWTAWKEDFKAFAPFLFRDSATVYVSLVFQGGKIGDATVMTRNDTLTAPPSNPSRTGYTFAGWYHEEDYLNSFDFSTDTVKKNITLYANWDINYYQVNFNSNGGTSIDDTLTLAYNSFIEEPTEPVKEGFIFDGWYPDDSFENRWDFSVNRVKNNLTLIAKWVDANSVSIYDKNRLEPILFPNPAESILCVGNIQSDALLEVFNLEGKQLLSHKISNPEEFIPINNLAPGVYFVKISTTDHVFQRIIMVDRN